MIGRTLEHYRIESKLGEGGMGVVYKAHDPRLNRPWPSRCCRPRGSPIPAAKQRFVQEARAASALNHPGIVTIHDIRSDAGIDFIVMEYIEGTTLDELIPATGMRARPGAALCRPDRGRARQGARGRHPSSGPEAVERHGHA